jgi:hypothetical protein
VWVYDQRTTECAHQLHISVAVMIAHVLKFVPLPRDGTRCDWPDPPKIRQGEAMFCFSLRFQGNSNNVPVNGTTDDAGSFPGDTAGIAGHESGWVGTTRFEPKAKGRESQRVREPTTRLGHNRLRGGRSG